MSNPVVEGERLRQGYSGNTRAYCHPRNYRERIDRGRGRYIIDEYIE